MRLSTIIPITVVLVLSPWLADTCAQEAPASREANKAAVAAWYADAKANHADDPDIMLEDGIIANRRTRRVEFFAETTGVNENVPMEFFLIGEKSGNGYEAFAVALTEPRHIHDAMLFIGLPPGRGIDHETLRFWPKGERVQMTVDGIRAESLVFDEEAGAPLEPSGFVFIGSRFVPSEADENVMTLSAQEWGPYAIAANYNEPNALFDVPFSAPQSSVYSKQGLNPDHAYPEGKLVPVVIEPEYTDGKIRIKNLRLHVSARETTTPALATASMTVKDEYGAELTESRSLTDALRLFSQLNDNGHDPFVTLEFGDDTTVAQLHQLAQLLQTIEGPRGIRIEPPLREQLYYKAFLPNERLRHRENRFLQPWELHLQAGADGSITGRVVEITETWIDGEAKPEIDVQDHAISAPQEVRQLLTTRRPDVKVLLVYAPATLTHAALMRFVGPVRSTHPVVRVYVEDREPTLPAANGETHPFTDS